MTKPQRSMKTGASSPLPAKGSAQVAFTAGADQVTDVLFHINAFLNRVVARVGTQAGAGTVTVPTGPFSFSGHEALLEDFRRERVEARAARVEKIQPCSVEVPVKRQGNNIFVQSNKDADIRQFVEGGMTTEARFKVHFVDDLGLCPGKSNLMTLHGVCVTVAPAIRAVLSPARKF
jgi:hypothetical protein